MLERAICRHTRDVIAKTQPRYFLSVCILQCRLSETVKSIRAAAKSPFLGGRAQDSRLKDSVCCLRQRAASREAALPWTAGATVPTHSLLSKEKGEIHSPPWFQPNCFVLLLLRVQFHRVAGVHIFQREDDHGGGCGRGYVQNHHFADGAPRQIAHMNVRPFGSGEALGLKRRWTHLRVF